MRIRILVAAALTLAAATPVAAADSGRTDDAYASAKSADIEALRLRLPARATVAATLLEAQEALRRYRQANPEAKAEARAVLDAAVARLELEANQR